MQKHIGRTDPESETQRAVTIVRNKPIVSRFHRKGGGDQYAFVTRAGYLKVDSILRLELKLFVVDPPGHVHQAMDLEHGLAIEAVIFFDLRLTGHSG